MLGARIKLRHLKCFTETVRLGGVARAGEALGISQPAVSKALAELEEIVGTPLFDRSRRALSLTREGELLARFARAGLATLQQGFDTLEGRQAGLRRVAFGALPTVAAGLVPRALGRFAASPFACPTRVDSGPSPYLLDRLRRAAIDFVVGRLASPAVMDGLSFEHLYSEHLAVVVRPRHPLVTKSPISLQDVVRYQLILPPKEAIIRPEVDTLLIAAGVARLEAEVETVSNSLGRSYTLASDAVWIISAGVVASDLAAGQLARLDIDVGATLGPIGITTRTGSDLSPETGALLDYMRRCAREVSP